MSRDNQRMYEFRTFRPEEVDESIRLSSYAFQFEPPADEWPRMRERLRPEQLWGAFAEDRLAAQVWLIPLTTYIQGKKFAMGGIANVASWPEHRRGGLVATLLIRTLEAMRSAGQTVSFLTPFSFAFYRRYGWETYVDRKRYTLTPSQLPKIAAQDVPGTIERIEQDSELLGSVYERFAERYNGMLSRDEHWWKDRIFPNRKGQIAVYKDASGGVQGYMHYQVKEREFTVWEMVALNREAQHGLWRFIGMHDSMVTRITLVVPVDDGLPLGLDDPRFEQKIEPYFMARIVDAAAFLSSYPFVPAEDRPAHRAGDVATRLTIEVQDEHAPWNNGTFEVNVDAMGNAAVRQTDREAGLRLSIQSLSALMMGYRSAKQLFEAGRIAGELDAVERLAAIIPARTPFLNDFF